MLTIGRISWQSQRMPRYPYILISCGTDINIKIAELYLLDTFMFISYLVGYV